MNEASWIDAIDLLRRINVTLGSEGDGIKSAAYVTDEGVPQFRATLKATPKGSLINLSMDIDKFLDAQGVER